MSSPRRTGCLAKRTVKYWPSKSFPCKTAACCLAVSLNRWLVAGWPAPLKPNHKRFDFKDIGVVDIPDGSTREDAEAAINQAKAKNLSSPGNHLSISFLDGKVSATIDSVSVECLPVNHPAIENQGKNRAAHSDYQLALTAIVGYKINDAKWLSERSGVLRPSDDVLFEAISEKGVVLGSGRGKFTFIGGLETGSETVSGTITGISDTEIQRVRRVNAKWAFGR